MEKCNECEYSKWIGVDGYGNYCSHPNNKNFKLIYEIEKCNILIDGKNNLKNEEE
jgi:hypothetical protein